MGLWASIMDCNSPRVTRPTPSVAWAIRWPGCRLALRMYIWANFGSSPYDGIRPPARCRADPWRRNTQVPGRTITLPSRSAPEEAKDGGEL